MCNDIYFFFFIYEGSWHLDDDILFAGYIFIESDSDSKTLEKLLWRIPNVVSPVRIGGDFNALNKEEETISPSAYGRV